MKLSTLFSWIKSKGPSSPDWSSRSTFSNGSSMPGPGYVYIGCRASVDRLIEISVNGTVALRQWVKGTSSESAFELTGQVPVASGDIVTCSLDAASSGGTTYQTYLYFVPIK